MAHSHVKNIAITRKQDSVGFSNYSIIKPITNAPAVRRVGGPGISKSNMIPSVSPSNVGRSTGAVNPNAVANKPNPVFVCTPPKSTSGEGYKVISPGDFYQGGVSSAAIADHVIHHRPVLQKNVVIDDDESSQLDYSSGIGTKRVGSFLPTGPISSSQYYEFEVSKRRKTERERGRGLRHFAMKVCEKVQEKKVTTYNEVADELVTDSLLHRRALTREDQAYDQKNIRRRVYDALNVLMAMNIISKEKKEIKWIGLPVNSSDECQKLEAEKEEILSRIKSKTSQLHELILQQVAVKKLIERNKERERIGILPQSDTCLSLPFIIINTGKDTIIDCSMSTDKTEYSFTFNDIFSIDHDPEVLKKMGLCLGLENGTISDEDLMFVKDFLPKAVEKHVLELAGKTPSTLENTSNTEALIASISSYVSDTSIDVLSDTDDILFTEGSNTIKVDSGIYTVSSSIAESADSLSIPAHDGPSHPYSTRRKGSAFSVKPDTDMADNSSPMSSLTIDTGNVRFPGMTTAENTDKSPNNSQSSNITSCSNPHRNTISTTGKKLMKSRSKSSQFSPSRSGRSSDVKSENIISPRYYRYDIEDDEDEGNISIS